MEWGAQNIRVNAVSPGTTRTDMIRALVADEAAVNAYNARVRQRTKLVEEYRAAAPVFNARVDKLAEDRKAYAAGCADRRFFEDDYDAIKAGK